MSVLRRAFACFIAVLASGAPAVAQAELQDAAYGPPEAMKGVYITGFEVSALRPCASERAACLRQDPEAPDACWVDFTPEASQRLEALSNGKIFTKFRPSRHWLEFTGRKTLGEGHYGHLGAYPCTIRVETITAYAAL